MLEDLLALQAQIKRTGRPFFIGCGICANVLGSHHLRLEAALTALGFNAYEPIPHYFSNQANRTLWVGEQRELRLDLLQKLITYYQEQEKC